MPIELILLIVVSVLLSSGSQVILKFAMTAPDIQIVLAQTDRPLQIAMSIITSPLVLAGLICFGLSALFWLFVLSKDSSVDCVSVCSVRNRYYSCIRAHFAGRTDHWP